MRCEGRHRRANLKRKVVKVRGTRTGKQGMESCATSHGPKWTAQRELCGEKGVLEFRERYWRTG